MMMIKVWNYAKNSIDRLLRWLGYIRKRQYTKSRAINSNKHYTDEEDKIIIDMIKQGKSYRQIARKLKRSYIGVKSYSIRTGLNKYR